MRKIHIGAQVSIDGIMQAPGNATEDPTNGFKFGGWAMPYFDDVAGAEMSRLFEEKFDLLLGRKTYEIFAAFWPYYDQSGEDGFVAKRFDEITKYVVSGSGDVDTGWQKSTLLRSVEDIKRLRESDGPTLLTQGSTDLVHALLAHDLVDAISLFTVPVVLGKGKKLFEDGSAPHSFTVSSSRAAGSGMVITHYQRAGAVKTANAVGPAPTDRERARQERMKQEG